jgi:hypothetical protein
MGTPRSVWIAANRASYWLMRISSASGLSRQCAMHSWSDRVLAAFHPAARAISEARRPSSSVEFRVSGRLRGPLDLPGFLQTEVDDRPSVQHRHAFSPAPLNAGRRLLEIDLSGVGARVDVPDPSRWQLGLGLNVLQTLHHVLSERLPELGDHNVVAALLGLLELEGVTLPRWRQFSCGRDAFIQVFQIPLGLPLRKNLLLADLEELVVG